jgi:SAM-dependent methyltransferase
VNPQEYKTLADELAKEAGVENGLHGYYLLHRNRFWQTASHFGLWDLRGKKILEIGPFFSYTPFVLNRHGNEVSVVEGDDPAVYPLQNLYAAHKIEFRLCDLFETFSLPSIQKHSLPFPDNHFDIISCWETMEHFNFNPIGFVRDLRRILKPSGRALITVPNQCKFESRLKLLRGKSIATDIDSYNHYYNYSGEKRFLGFHWREYVLSELAYLFRTQDFSIVSAEHLLTFHNHPNLTLPRKAKRLAAKALCSILPGMRNICAIVAQK